MIEYRITIPHHYYWMAGGNQRLFIQYVKGYIKKNHVALKALRIEGNFVICEGRPGYEERQEANKKAKNSTKRKRSKS